MEMASLLARRSSALSVPTCAIKHDWWNDGFGDFQVFIHRLRIGKGIVADRSKCLGASWFCSAPTDVAALIREDFQWFAAGFRRRASCAKFF